MVAHVNDTLLMDTAITLGLTKQDLVDLNLPVVRTFLQVSMISNISAADAATYLHRSVFWPRNAHSTLVDRKPPQVTRWVLCGGN